MVVFGSSWVGNGIGAAADPYRVRPASESPAAPNPYVLNTGVVKQPAGGSSQEILTQLRAARDRQPAVAGKSAPNPTPCPHSMSFPDALPAALPAVSRPSAPGRPSVLLI